MARYVTTVRTRRQAAEVFAFLSDLRHFADWDPGVRRVAQVEGVGGGAGAVFDVTVAGVPETTLRYRTVEYREPAELLVVARTRLLTSTDRTTVRSEGATTLVTYDADLRLNGLLGLGDPLLRLAFRRIGDRAAAGLRRALDGEEVRT